MKRIKEGYYKNKETGVEYFSISSFKKEYNVYNESEYSNNRDHNQKDSDELSELDYIDAIPIPFNESSTFNEGLVFNEEGLFKFYKTKG